VARSEPKLLKALLPQALESIAGRSGSGALLAQVWREAVGETIARQTALRTVGRGVLVVSCESVAWAKELEGRREELLQRLNARLSDKLTRLEIAVGGR